MEHTITGHDGIAVALLLIACLTALGFFFAVLFVSISIFSYLIINDEKEEEFKEIKRAIRGLIIGALIVIALWTIVLFVPMDF